MAYRGYKNNYRVPLTPNRYCNFHDQQGLGAKAQRRARHVLGASLGSIDSRFGVFMLGLGLVFRGSILRTRVWSLIDNKQTRALTGHNLDVFLPRISARASHCRRSSLGIGVRFLSPASLCLASRV